MPAALFNEKVLLRTLEAGGIALALLGLSLLIRRWFLRSLRLWAGADPNSFAAVLHEGLQAPTFVWCLVITLNWLLKYYDLPARTEALAESVIASFIVLSLAMAASSILLRTIQGYGERNHIPIAVAGLSRTLVQGFVFGVGLLVMLRMVGISVTPLLTALGVGGLAVALAVQDTLANLFAGIHLLVERPITVGDYVRLGADEEGTVSDIGWRTTRLLTGTNSTIVIPNKTVTSSNLLNYSLPTRQVGVFVPILVSLEADIAQVEALALASALATEGVLADPPPIFLADPGLTPTHLQFRLAFQVPQQAGSGLIKTRVVKKLLERFREAEIRLPNNTYAQWRANG